MTSSERRSPWAMILALASIVAVVLAAYSDATHGPQVFDDRGSILENPSIRSISTSLHPPNSGWPVAGRPLLNLSFALNYAAAGLDTHAYHLTNIAIHLAASLVLFGLLLITMRRLGYSGCDEVRLAWAAALLWACHPLQTEAVTYISQRAESLMGLWYLLTLFCFARSQEPKARTPLWLSLSVFFVFLGSASKEVIATAPLIVVCYDRVFVSKSWKTAWSAKRAYYICLVASWLPLGWLAFGTGGRGGTAGFGAGLAWWAYAMTQIHAVGLYLWLSVIGWPLRFTYGLTLGGPPLELIVVGLILLAAAIASLVGVHRGSRLGFAGLWFLLILAPSSSILPVSTELIAEHRVYLSLAALTTVAVLFVDRGLRRVVASPRRQNLLFLTITGCLCATAAAATYERNHVYDSVLAIWRDTVSKAPEDPGARNNYGNSLADAGEPGLAIEQYQQALKYAPGYGDPEHNWGNALVTLHRLDEAISHFEKALEAKPDDSNVLYQLGDTLWQLGRRQEGLQYFVKAYSGETESAGTWNRLGLRLEDAGRLQEAEGSFARSLAIQPEDTNVLLNHATALAELGRTDEAVAEFTEVLKRQPKAADVHNNLGGLLAQSGRFEEAQVQFEAALALDPNYAEARSNLEKVKAIRAQQGR